MGLLVDRMSINIELAKKNSLELLAPDKKYDQILSSMDETNKRKIEYQNDLVKYKNTPKFLPAGQTSQMIIGANGESDLDIIEKSQSLYDNFSLKRVYYSAFVPVVKSKYTQSKEKTPLIREHRIYQADWLLRFYGFKPKDLLNENKKNFDLNLDPKTSWAIDNIEKFPLEINKASYKQLIKVPGIGKTYAQRIIQARKFSKLNFSSLKSLKISTKNALNFITVDGKYRGIKYSSKENLKNHIIGLNNPKYEQMTLWNII